jgi:DNA ligase (NAD+)
MFRKIVDFLKDKLEEVTLQDALDFIQEEDLSQVEGFSDNSNKTLKQNILKIHPVIKELLKLGVDCQKEKNIGGDLKGTSFCFTGSLDTMKRKEAEDLVISKGAKVASVSKNLTYLVTNDTSSGSSKNKKAASLGVQIIDEKTFRTLVGI